MSIVGIADAVEGVGKAVGSTVEKVAGVFTSNAENDAERSSQEQMALLQQYQAEFNQRENRTWIDAFADAFNRLIRPFIVTIIICIFVIAYVSPTHFAQITLAISSIPDGYWALLSVIIAFYFGGRMQLKSQEFKFQKNQAAAVEALIKAKKEFRNLEMDDDEPDKVIGDSVAKSEAVGQERTTQANEVVKTFLELSSDKAATQATKEKALQEAAKKLDKEDTQALVTRRRNGPRRTKEAMWPLSAINR